jgi:hypothetical protein
VLKTATVARLGPVTDFEYLPEEGVLIFWTLSLSGYDGDVDDLDGDFDPMDALSEIEATMENFEDEYREASGATLVRVHGAHGWRVYQWDNGAVHRYEWKYTPQDRRCPRCKRGAVAGVYMVTDELWASSGLDGWPCFWCLEEAIGRRLVPADFQPGLPCNSDLAPHGRELRDRMGLT